MSRRDEDRRPDAAEPDTRQVPRRRTGRERFHVGGQHLPVDVTQFWSWSASDLLSNTLRGRLAEFIVATALGRADGIRQEWDDVDLRLADGTSVEVKSAAYVQSWQQREPSKIRFDIAPTLGWDAETNVTSDEVERRATVYVFCLLGAPDRLDVDPLDLGQWRFFVLPTRVLDARLPGQKKIRLAPLLRLGPTECEYSALAATVLAATRQR